MNNRGCPYGWYPCGVCSTPCHECRAQAGAYWLGMLGFALAAPAATERAAQIFEEIDPLWADGVLRGQIFDAAYGWDGERICP